MSCQWLVSLASFSVLTALWRYALFTCQRRKAAPKLTSEEEKPEEVHDVIPLLCLPQEVRGLVFSFGDTPTLSHVSSSCKKFYSGIWSNQVTWSSMILSLGLVPEQDASAEILQDKVRRMLYGIDHLCQQQQLSGKQSRIVVRGDQCSQLQRASRACSGLHFVDGAEISELVISRCLELLVSFNVDDTEARRHASDLASVVSGRTDVFCPEQCSKVENALSDAMDLHELLHDVMLEPAEIETALDDALAAPFDAEVWGEHGLPCGTSSEVQDEGACRPDVEAALDRLIFVLRDIVNEDEAAGQLIA